MSTPLPLLPAEVDRPRDDRDEAGVGTLATERGNLPLDAVDVHAEITGLLARTRLRQSFVNPFDEPLEATYIFPLPGRAAVTEFSMELPDRTVRGVLKEREAARADYDRAIEEGKRAAIAEEERQGVFTVRVGNLRPGERATVHLTMTGPLAYDDGEATYRFPLVVAPRYIPGRPLPDQPVGDGVAVDTDAVPDASRITPPVLLPGFPNPIRLSITAELDPAGLHTGEPRASLHTVVAEERDGGGRVVRVAPGDRADRDFLLRFPVAEDDVRTALVTATDAPAEAEAEAGTEAAADGGTFALTVVPPAGLAASDRPRDVVLVLDRSGSMHGWKIVAARRAAARIADSLGDRDRLAVLAFDHSVETPGGLPERALAPATDRNRYRAVEFLAGLDARGGTELLTALSAALDRLGDPGAGAGSAARDRVLVLVTDGQIGNEDHVLRQLAPRLAGTRVFAVGIDTAVNASFLERLAALGGGGCELVESEDRLDGALDRIHRRIASPVLVDLRLEDGGLGLDGGSVAPSRLPDLFAGSPLVISGRWRAPATRDADADADADAALTVTGRTADGEPWRARVQAVPTASGAIAPVWARARLRDLEDRYVTGGDAQRELERELVETSLRHGVLCRFTAFVAVDERVVNEGGTLRRVTQPVDAPAGWDMFDQAVPASPGFAAMAPMAAGPGIVAAPQMRRAGFERRRLGGAQAMPTMDEGFGGIVQPDVLPPAPGGPGGPGTVPGGGLDAERARAARLLAVLERGSGDDLTLRLRALESALDEVVEALRGARAPEAVLRPLAEALQAVRRTVRDAAPSEGDLDRSWRDGLAALRGFATPETGAGSGARTGRRRAFWRRGDG